MKLPQSDTITTAGEAEDLAIKWQFWATDQSLSYGECAEWQALFETLGSKYNLTDEFKENGII